MQRCIYQLSAINSLYRSKVELRQETEDQNQNLKNELGRKREQSTKLGSMIEKLEDKAALFESTSAQLECELSVVRSELINSRKDLDT